MNSFHSAQLKELPNVENVYEMFRFKATQLPNQHSCGYRKVVKEIMERDSDGKRTRLYLERGNWNICSESAPFRITGYKEC